MWKKKMAGKEKIGKIIDCSSLVSLMKDQVERCNKIPNQKAAYIGKWQSVMR